jgi:Secretion system C-terminal sorting domain
MIRWTGLLVAILILANANVSAQPVVSDEHYLDHGFRYHSGELDILGLSVSAGDEHVLFSWHSYPDPHNDVFGLRTYPDGAEVDRSSRPIVNDSIVQHVLSGRDALGWKVFQEFTTPEGDATGLRVSSQSDSDFALLAEQVIVAPDVEIRSGIDACYNGLKHTIIWVEDDGVNGRLKIASFDAELTLLDPGISLVSEDVGTTLPAVCMDELEGLTAWSNEAGQLMIRSLTAEGAPTGAAHLLALTEGGEIRSVRIARLGLHWLVFWNYDFPYGDSQACYALISILGTLLQPGVVTLPNRDAAVDIGLATGSENALLTWRGDGVHAARVLSNGLLLDPTPIELAPWASYYEGWLPDEKRHCLDCTWTGDSFVVTWNNWVNYQENRREIDEDLNRVFARWIDSDGAMLGEAPVPLNRMFAPSRCTVSHHDGDNYCVIRNHHCDDFHGMKVDWQGEPVTEPVRFDGHSDDVWSDGLLNSRPCDGGIALVTHYSTRWEFVPITIDMLNAMLITPEGTGIEVFYTWAGNSDNPTVDIHSMDLAVGQSNEIVLVHSAYLSTEDHYQVFVNSQPVDSDGRDATSPTVVRNDSGYLMLWSELQDGQHQLYRAILTPGSPGDNVIGERIVINSDSYTHLYLAPGPDQFLCVMYQAQVDMPPDELGDIYGIRFDGDGNLLDSEPFLICDMAEPLGWPKAVWNGVNYLVTWSITTNYPYSLYGGHVSEAGEVLDGNGFMISSGYSGYGDYSKMISLASSGEGITAVSYYQNRLRYVFDDEYFSAIDWQADDATGQFFAMAPYPNPTEGNLILRLSPLPESDSRLELVDVSGRVIQSRLVSSYGGEVSLDLGDLPKRYGAGKSGVYWLRVQSGNQTEARRIILVK